MSLLRTFECTSCAQPAEGIPFGGLSEQLCHECWFAPGEEPPSGIVYGAHVTHACGHRMHYTLEHEPTAELVADLAARLCLGCQGSIPPKSGRKG
ncbi:MAG: hypothetical protein ACK47B_23715 [Armatimonadota bacterium]